MKTEKKYQRRLIKTLVFFLAILLTLLMFVGLSSCTKEESVKPEGGCVNIYSKHKSAVYSIAIENSDSVLVKSYSRLEYLNEVDSIKNDEYPFLLSIKLSKGLYAMKVVCKKTGSFGFKTINTSYVIDHGKTCEMFINY
jgi:hypothetical protein